MTEATYAQDIGEYLASHGGPFYELQRRVGLLERNALQVGRRAAIFIALAWGGPFILSLVSGHAFGDADSTPFLLDFSALARFFIAIGLFLLAERQIEEGLRGKLNAFVRAPVLAPESIAPAQGAVVGALKARDSGPAELVCLGLGIAAAIYWAFHLAAAEQSTWAVVVDNGAARITLAGWWSIVVSVPTFNFLLFRGLWRYCVWAMLLRRIANLNLRLVATHPDGKGGIGFVADYPNAYALFVLGMSSALAVIVVRHVSVQNISSVTFGYILMGWLAIVFALFWLPLVPFTRPLSQLKSRSIDLFGSAATRYHRGMERGALGHNVMADDPSEASVASPAADPSLQFLASRKLSVFLMNRQAVAPLAAAALIPFAIAGATNLPYKEVFSLLKKLVVL